MSETISRQTGPTTDPGVERGKSGMGWRRLQLVAAAAAAVSLVAPMVIEGEIVGFLAAMAAPFLIGLLLAAFLPRTAAIFLGVVSLGILLSSVPFLAESLLHPESPSDFIPLVLLVVSAAIGTATAIPAFKEARAGAGTSGTPRAIAIAAVAVLAVASAASLVSAASLEDATAQPGDVAVLTRDFVFEPTELTADAGTVAVHLTNEDKTRHTFTIDGLTDISVAPGQAQRGTFEAEPGTYRFYCKPHAPDMEGTLVVE